MKTNILSYPIGQKKSPNYLSFKEGWDMCIHLSVASLYVQIKNFIIMEEDVSRYWVKPSSYSTYYFISMGIWFKGYVMIFVSPSKEGIIFPILILSAPEFNI